MKELLYQIHVRPLCISCGIFIFVLYLGSAAPERVRPYMTLAAILIFVTAVIISFTKRITITDIPLRKFLPFPAAAVLAASLVSQFYFGVYINGLNSYAGEVHNITAEVISVKYSTVYSTEYLVRITDIDGEGKSFKALLLTEYPSEFEMRDILSLEGEFEEFSDSYAGYDEKRYNFSKGIFLQINTESPCVKTGESSLTALHLAAELNEMLRNTLFYLFDNDDAAGFVSGILLGNRSDVAHTVKRDFRALGLSHLLALSGLHLSILHSTLQSVLKAFRIRKRARLAIGIAAVSFYMMLTGMTGSVMRGGIMLIISSAVCLMRRSYDPITALFLSVTLICAFSPASVCDIGLIMSFAATWGVLTLGSSTDRYMRKTFPGRDSAMPLRRIRSFMLNCAGSLTVSAAALLFTLPVTWFTFGEISAVGIIATPIAAVFISLILTLSPLIIIFSKIDAVSGLLVRLITAVYVMTESVCKSTASPDLLISLNYGFTPWVLLTAVIGIVITYGIVKAKSPFALFIPIGISAIIFAVCVSWHTSVTAEAVSLGYIVSKKNEMLVLNSHGNGLICDISDGTKRPALEAEYLIGEEFSMTGIDAYMLTHYHRRHVSTFMAVADRTYIEKLYLPLPFDKDDAAIADSLISAASEREIPVILYEPGRAFEYSGSHITLCEESRVGYSEHPIIALSIMTETGGVLYAGSSAYNSGAYEFCEEAADSSDRVIFGIHGPKRKFGIIADSHENVKYIYTADTQNILVEGYMNAECITVSAGKDTGYSIFKIE